MNSIVIFKAKDKTISTTISSTKEADEVTIITEVDNQDIEVYLSKEQAILFATEILKTANEIK